MSDDSPWMPPGQATPPPPPPSVGEGQPTPSAPYLPPNARPSDERPTYEQPITSPPSMTVPAGPPPGIPPLEPTSAPPSRRRKGVLFAAVVTVLAVGGAATFAATQLTGGTGGADSALQVGEQVLASIENEDVLGLLDVLLPGERELFRQPAIDWVAELSRLEVLSPAADLAAIEGIDLSVAGGSVQVRDTNVADITNIELTGEITATVDGEALPIGDLVLDLADDADTELAELDETTSTELELPLTAVEVDGRWYLSVFYSVAEAARMESSSPPDIPESGIQPTGGATPEDALDELLDAVEQLDVSAVIASLNPGEAGALQRYAPLFIDEAQSLYDEAPFEFEVTQAEYTVTGDGSRRHASIDVVAIEGSADGSSFEVEYSDGCLNVSADGEEFNSCELDEQLSGQDFEQFDDMFSEGPVRDLIDLLDKTFADYEQPGITIVQTDGSWYVSPIGTYFDQFLALARAVDRAEIDALIEAVPLAAQAFFEEFLGTDFFFEDLDDPFLDDPILDDPYLDDPFVYDTLPDVSFPDDTVPGDTIPIDTLARCWEMPDANDASACFQEAMAADGVHPVGAPVEMLHPECGVAEAYWNQYKMTDVEFFELIDAARPCFLALVASGELNQTDLPTEYTKPECYEGRNWYQVLDDPEYDQRVSDCASG